MLTRRQRQLLDYLEKYIEEHRIAPTQEEMRIALGKKSGGYITDLLRQLEAKGYIDRLPRKNRAISIRTKGIGNV